VLSSDRDENIANGATVLWRWERDRWQNLASARERKRGNK